MSDVIDFYQQQARARVSTTAWVAQLQADALADFARFGFPKRHDEEWKYTQVAAFLQHRFECASSVMPANEINNIAPLTAYRLAIHNGLPVGLDELQAQLPPGVIVQPLAEAIVLHADKVKPYLGQILQHEHGFHALNTALLQHGLFIYVPKGVCLEQPLWLMHAQTTLHHATYFRHLVIAEAGSSATLIEDYQGAADTCYATNVVTEVLVAAHAKLVHYKLQRESKAAYHFSHLSVKQAQDSDFSSHLFNLGGQLVRTDASLYLQEPGARCLLNGLYVPADGQHMDQHTSVYHEVLDCCSEQDYKGILSGHSRAVFNGKVVVAKHAQRTEAKQQNKNLLLSLTAEIDTKPQLDIYADDVVCTHGATVGQLDEDALFYLATRGIGHAEACQYLVQAFAAQNLSRLPDAQLANWLGTALTQQIGSIHG